MTQVQLQISPAALRIGMIVPSSNVTMERELPKLFSAQARAMSQDFGFHAARVRMRNVSPEELLSMNSQASRAAEELADAQVDVLLYACLVAVMVEGPGAHCLAESRLKDALQKSGRDAPVISSAGALVNTLHDMGARRIGLIAPYAPALTEKVCQYLAAESIEVVSSRSRNLTNNSEVGRLDQLELLELARTLPRDIDAVVLSACVQMPSLDMIQRVEDELKIPVISAATATAYQCLKALGIQPEIHGAGRLLAGTEIPAVSLLPRQSPFEVGASVTA